MLPGRKRELSSDGYDDGMETRAWVAALVRSGLPVPGGSAGPPGAAAGEAGTLVRVSTEEASSGAAHWGQKRFPSATDAEQLGQDGMARHYAMEGGPRKKVFSNRPMLMTGSGVTRGGARRCPQQG